jgi:transcriptional regulator with XRE-family HTH domain
VLRNYISQYRESAGLTQDQLAEAIGTTRSFLGKMERGQRSLTSDWLEKIGQALLCAPYLLIAPPNILPTEEELAEMLASAQQTLPAGLPYSEWPRAVAEGLHMRLRTLASDRANARSVDA